MANGDERLITAEVNRSNSLDDNFTELSLAEIPIPQISRPSRPTGKTLSNSRSPTRSPHGQENSRPGSRDNSLSNSRKSPQPRDPSLPTPVSSSVTTNGDTYVHRNPHHNGLKNEDPPLRANSEETVPMGSPVSRAELLDIVRKHAHIVQRKKCVSFADQRDPEPCEEAMMEPRYWREMFDLFYVKGWRAARRRARGRPEGAAGGEDVLFFVREGQLEHFAPGSGEEEEEDSPKPYLERSWDSKLSAMIGAELASVDWRRSFFLNLISQTVYTLTVAVCSRKELEAHKINPKSPAVVPIQRSTKRVYASPGKCRVDSLEDPLGAYAYPKISFSVADSADTILPVELTDPDHCLCVLLNAHSGAAFPESEDSGSGSASPVFRLKRKGRAKVLEDLTGETPRVTLFSGFVSHAMVKGSFHGAGVGGLGFWGGEQKPQSERLLMKGPGGRGEAEVTMSHAPAKEHLQALNEPGVSGGGAEPSRLRELQEKLVQVQEELTRLLTQHQAQGGSGGGGADVYAAARERQYQARLSSLNEKLVRVQGQLQDMQKQENDKEEEDLRQPPGGGQSELRKPLPGGLTDFMRRAASAMTPTASSPLICSLRSLVLPWEALAYDLLFKSAPMKVDITGHVFPRLPNRT